MYRVLGGFAAGFLAVLTVHQGILWLGTALHFFQAQPWSFRPVPPLGIPQVLSLAFWGGLWGVLIAFLAPKFGSGFGWWLSVFVIFGLATTLVGWYVVGPLKGQKVEPIDLNRLVTGLVINGGFALGAAAILRLLPSRFSSG